VSDASPEERMGFVERVLLAPDGTPLGERLDDWQRQDLAAATAGDRHVWWERPRTHSKTEDAAAVALTDLVLGPPGQRIPLAATDTDQAALVLDSLRQFVARSPLLSGSLRVLRREVVYDSRDSSVEVLPADSAGSWGWRPSLVVCDELSQWRTPAHEDFFWSLWSALGKVKGARILVCLTAHWDRTGLAWRVRKQVRRDPRWAFSRRAQCASWIRPEFLDEQRRLLPDHLFRMLHLNEWTQVGGSFFTWQEIDGIFTGAPARGDGPVAVGVDLGLTRDRTAVAVVRLHAPGRHRWPLVMPDGTRHAPYGTAPSPDEPTVAVEDLLTWTPRGGTKVDLTDVEEHVARIARALGAVVVVDAYQAALLAQRLRGRGLNVEEVAFTTTSRRDIYATLFDLVRRGCLKSIRHEGLREELSNLEVIASGTSWRPDHPSGGHDDLAIAVGLGAWNLARHYRAPFPQFYERIGRADRIGGPRIDAADIRRRMEEPQVVRARQV
jgi:phage terminase large subunit-like protein